MDPGKAIHADCKMVSGRSVSMDDVGGGSCRLPDSAGVAGTTAPCNGTGTSDCPEHVARSESAAAPDAVSFDNRAVALICTGVTWRGRLLSPGLQDTGDMPSIEADGCVVAVALMNSTLGTG